MSSQSAPLVRELVKCQVVKAESIGSDTVQFWITPVDESSDSVPTQWEPGSHIDIHADEGLVRQYSLLPSSSNIFSFAIKKTSSPSQERIRRALQVGETVSTGLPRSIMNLDKAASNHHFVAAGIGITPFISMIAYAAEHLPGHVSLTYIARKNEDFLFIRQLENIFKDTHNVFNKIVTSVSGRPKIENLFQSGSSNDAYYFCGPTELISQATAYAQTQGLSKVYAEYFSKVDATNSAQKGSKEVRLIFSRSAKSIFMDENSTILKGIRKAGIQITTSCERGICGACELEIVAGQAHHLDQIMSTAEKEAHEFVFPCVSKVANEYLEIDI